jgi:Bacterial antitoxin of type II TA system, VapB
MPTLRNFFPFFAAKDLAAKVAKGSGKFAKKSASLKTQGNQGGKVTQVTDNWRFKVIVLHTSMCKYTHMATNLGLDDRLIEEARRVGRHKTKKEAVSAALAEYVKRRKQLRILDIFGTVDFDPKYDYKAERRRKRS